MQQRPHRPPKAPKGPKKHTPQKKPKPWKTHKLKRMEKEVHRKANLLLTNHTGEARKNYFLALKLYKKERKYTIRSFKNNKITQLQDLKQKI